MFIAEGLSISQTTSLLFLSTMMFIMINLKVVNSLIKTNFQMSALAIISMSKNISSVLSQLTGAKVLVASNYAYFYWLLAVIAFVGVLGSCFIRDGESTGKMFE